MLVFRFLCIIFFLGFSSLGFLSGPGAMGKKQKVEVPAEEAEEEVEDLVPKCTWGFPPNHPF